MATPKIMPRVPRSHLSVRVPWHDAGWDGTVCRAPRQNSSCLALNRIGAAKRDETEERHAGQFLDSVPHDEAPPCFSERVSFLSARPQHRLARHAYARTSDDHRHIRDTLFLHPAFSAAATPFGWLLKDRAWGEKWKKGSIDANALAERWGIDSHPEYEPDAPDWLHDRPWIQGHRNQQGLLDAFFSAIEPKESLVFFYAKRTPLLDDDQWIIVGAAKVTSIGDLREWDYESGATSPIRSYLWERSVCHSLRPDGSGGVLLPLHELLKQAEADPALDISDCIAFVPPEYRSEFSYASELVSQGTAISALLAMKEALATFGRRFGGAWGSQLKWIDERLGELWELRGPYPGLGSLLTALGVPHGHQLAQHAWSLAGKNGDTWTALGKLVAAPATAPRDLVPQLAALKDIWTYLHSNAGTKRRTLAKLLARVNLSSEQAARWWDPAARSAAELSYLGKPIADDAIVINPYLLFECDRGQVDPTAFRTVDQAVFPQAAVLDAHPVPVPSAMTGPVDGRRLRAATLSALEEAANDGHTLLGRDMVLAAVKGLAIEPPLPATTDHFEIHGEALKPQIEHCTLDDGAPAFQLDRLAAARTLIERTVIKRVRQGKRLDVPVDWRATLDSNLPGSAPKGSLEDQGRNEKAAALRELAASRLSVLIGAAGTGKTTLLRFLCQAAPIKNAGVLLLAPTGKARVRLQTQTGISAKTLAQFLRPRRYREATQSYHVIGDLERSSGQKAVIVDEASMLTEEQLAALIDALSSVDRIILVGDPSQLPPIGAGRPFVDIVSLLAPETVTPGTPRVAPGYAELTVGSRQRGADRKDLELADLFSGRASGPASDEIISHLYTGYNGDHLRLCLWSSPSDLASLLPQIMAEELGIDPADREASFSELALGGTRSGTHVYFNFWSSGPAADKWQILSPLRGDAAGTLLTNRLVQKYFRGETRKAAELADRRYAKVSPPMGNDGIIYGDKVINLGNHRRTWVYPEADSDGNTSLCYVANGEIGIATGPFRKKGKKTNLNNVRVTFSSQTGFEYTYWPSDLGEDSSLLELAYALTVHKAQGSEFDTVFVVLPNPCRILSRELLYTALTRQSRRLVILCQGDPHRLVDFRHLSDAARRLTNLFAPPRPIVVGTQIFDGKHIHRSRRGELMISKSEVIIANELQSAGLDYAYERPLIVSDGSRRYPDFTIEDAETGNVWYWEHLGMKGDAEYDRKWALKLRWYRDNGILPDQEGGGPNGILVTTEEFGGIQTGQITALISKIKEGA